MSARRKRIDPFAPGVGTCSRAALVPKSLPQWHADVPDTFRDRSEGIQHRLSPQTSCRTGKRASEQNIYGRITAKMIYSVNYLLNYDEATKHHVIGPKREENINGVMIGEASGAASYKPTLQEHQEKDRITYFRDQLIQRTCQNALNGTLGGNSNSCEGALQKRC